MLIQTKVLKQYLKRFENQKFVLPVKHMLSSKVKISFLVLLYGQLMQNLIASCCKNMTQQNPSTVLRHMEACYRAKRQSIRVGVLEGQDFFAGVRPSKKCTMNLIDYSSWQCSGIQTPIVLIERLWYHNLCLMSKDICQQQGNVYIGRCL